MTAALSSLIVGIALSFILIVYLWLARPFDERPKYVIHKSYETEEVDVGKTTVKVTLEDGRIGLFQVDGYINKDEIIHSLDVLPNVLGCHEAGQGYVTFIDMNAIPTTAIRGRPVEFEVQGTEKLWKLMRKSDAVGKIVNYKA